LKRFAKGNRLPPPETCAPTSKMPTWGIRRRRTW